MLYAKIVNEKKTVNGNNMILVFFYGESSLVFEHRKAISAAKGNPLDYLAEHGFRPVSDKLFFSEST